MVSLTLSTTDCQLVPKGCMDAPVGFCPYWEPGCLCVMTFFGDPIAECWAKNCVGEDIVVAASLATSVCHSIGAPDWKISPSLSTVLSELATAIPTITETEAPSSSQAPESTSTEVSSEATSDASTSSKLQALLRLQSRLKQSALLLLLTPLKL